MVTLDRLADDMKRTLVKTGTWMLIMLFLSYYVSISTFYHTHHFNWGTVTHSHPYVPFGQGSANHTHTPIQCQTISVLSNLLLIFSVISVFIFKTGIVQKIYVRVYSFISCFKPIFSSLRAPPVLEAVLNF